MSIRKNKIYGNVVFITGARSGVGRFVADRLAKEGYRVYGTSRSVKAGEFEEPPVKNPENGGLLRLINMDIRSENSIEGAMQYILKLEGRIDILVNNSGIVSAGSVEDTSFDEAYNQFEVNFFGTHRVLRQVLPVMRRQKKGLIINISSVAGFIALPFQSMYCASKAAVEVMSESLRIEVKKYGIRVVIIEPGDMKTGNTAGRLFAAASADSVYKESFRKSISMAEKGEINGPEPVSVANTIARLVRRKNPPIRVVTTGIQYKLIRITKKILPDRLVSYIVGKIY